MNEKIKKIADHYGLEQQLDQTIEECAELIVASRKVLRCGALNQNLLEEIADVSVMIEQLKYLTDAREIECIMAEKIERQIRRIGEDVREI